MYARRDARNDAGFSLIEVLASITIFTLTFLAGTAGIARLLVTQNHNYQHTVAGAAAMLLADWHVKRCVSQSPAMQDFIANTTTAPNQILVERLSVQATPWDNVKFHGGDFVATGANADRVFSFTAASVTDALAGCSIDVSEYLPLMVTVSPASTSESDTSMTFREVSFWYLPERNLADAIAGIYTVARPTVATFVGRYLIPDAYSP